MSLSKIVMSSYILESFGPFPRVPGTSRIRSVSSIHQGFQYYHPPPDDLEVGEVLGSIDPSVPQRLIPGNGSSICFPFGKGHICSELPQNLQCVWLC